MRGLEGVYSYNLHVQTKAAVSSYVFLQSRHFFVGLAQKAYCLVTYITVSMMCRCAPNAPNTMSLLVFNPVLTNRRSQAMG